jgi:hypothetical protein
VTHPRDGTNGKLVFKLVPGECRREKLSSMERRVKMYKLRSKVKKSDTRLDYLFQRKPDVPNTELFVLWKATNYHIALSPKWHFNHRSRNSCYSRKTSYYIQNTKYMFILEISLVYLLLHLKRVEASISMWPM